MKTYETNYCKIVHLKNKNAIFCQWKQFCKGDDYRTPFKEALKLINEYDLTTWITDTTNGFENEKADTIWLVETFMPQLIKSSVKKIVFIIKKDSPLIAEIQGQVDSLGAFFEVELVEELKI